MILLEKIAVAFVLFGLVAGALTWDSLTGWWGIEEPSAGTVIIEILAAMAPWFIGAVIAFVGARFEKKEM